MSSQDKEKETFITDEHLIKLDDLVKKLNTDIKEGLTTKQAANKLEKDGLNELTPPPKESLMLKFLKIQFGGFSLLLWIAGALCFLAYGIESIEVKEGETNPPDYLYLGIVLCAVVLLTGIFSFYQEYKADETMEKFKNMVPPHANVLRDGKWQEIEASQLVKGDIVEIKQGNKVPADLRIVEADMLKVDLSSLTGESNPISLDPEKFNKDPAESKNVAFYSTNITEGVGKGIVILTGDQTRMGCIAKLVADIKKEQTPINKEIENFIHLITALAMFLGIVFFAFSLAKGDYWIDSVVFFIGILVANVPEGLLITVTVALTLTAKKMAAKKCLVKNLEAVETLGSTSVICTDKTGTLTQNKMTVAHAWFNKTTAKIDIEMGKDGIEPMLRDDPAWIDLANTSLLASKAKFKETDEDSQVRIQEREVDGDATETGLLKCFESIRGNYKAVRENNPTVVQIPFSSRTKFAVNVVDIDKKGKYSVMMKGAPEIVFDRCSTILISGKEVSIDDKIKKEFQKACEDLGSLGERVMGFCHLDLDNRKFPKNFKFKGGDDANFPVEGLRFDGLLSLIDPPKVTVPDAVNECRSAGIRVIMVTGDHAITAGAIAKQVGIFSKKNKIINYTAQTQIAANEKMKTSAVVEGKVLADMSQADLDNIIQNHWEIVFARTSPEQKYNIVDSFQRAKNIVAVTGDGVNDSPALKKADIGVSMGIAGTEVSKEAADMILLDDDFSTIVHGVEEGRLIFDNLKKSIVYTLTSNIPELLPFLAMIIFNIPLPLGTITILMIDLGTDMVPAISLAFESPEEDIMKRPPRDPTQDRLVNGRTIYLAYCIIGVMQAAAGFFVYFVIMAEHGFLPSTLIGLGTEWMNMDNNAVKDSFGQEWSFGQRNELMLTCQTCYFLSIVEVQWADLIISKTRWVSITTQGFWNQVLNASLVFETLLACALIYIPGFGPYIGMYPIAPRYWLVALPFTLVIFLMDELRRFLMRQKDKKGPLRAIGEYIYELTYY